MDENKPSPHFTIVLLGDECINKNLITTSYLDNSVMDSNYLNNPNIDSNESMIGIESKNKIIQFKSDVKIKLTLIETAGQEKFNDNLKTVYRTGNGFIIFFDHNNDESINSVVDWYENIKTNSQKNEISFLIVGIHKDNDDIKQNINERLTNDFKKIDFFCEENNKLNILNCNINKIEDINKIFESITTVICEFKEKKKEEEKMNDLGDEKENCPKSCFFF